VVQARQMSVRSSCSPQQELQAAYVVRTCLIWSDRDGDQVCFRMLCGVVQVVCVCVRPESRAPSDGCIVRARCVLVVARQGVSVQCVVSLQQDPRSAVRRVRHVHGCASAIDQVWRRVRSPVSRSTCECRAHLQHCLTCMHRDEIATVPRACTRWRGTRLHCTWHTHVTADARRLAAAPLFFKLKT
jgi:hypothetical protein